MGIFSPNQSNETGLEFSVLEEKPSNISERTITTSKQEESQEATLLEESLLKLSDTEVNYVSPYFSDEPKIKDRKADNSLVDCEKSQPTDGNSVQSTGVTDQQNRITRTAGKCRKLREIGTYDANLVEKEFQNLVHQLNLKRQHDAETFQQFSQSLRMKTEAIINSLDTKFKAGYAMVDEKLNKAGNELMGEVEKGHQMEGDLNVLKTRVAGILQHLQMLTGISSDSGELIPPSPKKSQNMSSK